MTEEDVSIRVSIRAFPKTFSALSTSFFPQMDGNTGRTSGSYQHTECLQEKKDREGECQPQREPERLPLTDIDTVYDIIQGIHQGADYSRNRIMKE